MLVSKIHKVFAMVAFATIVIFWSSTLIAELFFTYEIITAVKSLIVFSGLFILIPFIIIITAISGNIISKKSTKTELIKLKKKRMPIIGILGVFILIPSAIYLDFLATNQLFDFSFYLVQGLELSAGFINIVLMSLNIKDSKTLKY